MYISLDVSAYLYFYLYIYIYYIFYIHFIQLVVIARGRFWFWLHGKPWPAASPQLQGGRSRRSRSSADHAGHFKAPTLMMVDTS